MYNMELNRIELTLIILGMEALMEQLKDDGIGDVLDEQENRRRYHECLRIARMARIKLNIV
tara:strand:- start:1068 stop:1250 length:183 start_codon:yes stop_codon:yes gene_type:complete